MNNSDLQEIWKDIPGYEGIYQISNKGNILALNYHLSNKPSLLKQDTSDKRGYRRITLSKNSGTKRYCVHRLEWETFYGPIPKGMQINHKDENPANNLLYNLELVNAAGNINYGHHNKKVSQALKNHPVFSRPVSQYTLDGELIATYPSISQACRDNGFKSCGNINSCLKGKYKHAYGFKWK